MSRPRLWVATGVGAAGVAARSSAHELGTMRATWILGVHTVHTTQFCDNALYRSLFGSLFMDTVHEHCSQGFKKKEYKNFKNFIVYDLIYKIFILKLL